MTYNVAATGSSSTGRATYVRHDASEVQAVTLDPEMAVVVDMANAAAHDSSPLVQEDVATIRELALAGARAYGPGPDSPVGVDQSIPGPRGDVPVRIYLPEGAPTGVVTFFHGSGFVIFDLDSHDREARLISAGTGAVVVSVDYALAPEQPFPAAVDDCVAATRWVAANRDQLGAADMPVAVMGDSAGGNLAAVVSRELRSTIDVDLAGQVLVYPVTDLVNRASSYSANGVGYLLTAETMEFFIACYTPNAGDRQDHRASPLLADDLVDLPRTLVITAEYDPLRDEGEAYAHRLREAGVDVTVKRYDGAVHGFFQMTNFSELARDAMAQCCNFIRTAFADRLPAV